MVAEKLSINNELSTCVAKLTEDEKIRQQCEARERYEAHERGIKKLINKLEDENQNLNAENQRLRQKLIDAGIDPDE